MSVFRRWTSNSLKESVALTILTVTGLSTMVSVISSPQVPLQAESTSVAISSRKLTPAEILERTTESVALIQVSTADGTGYYGSGFAIDDAGTLVTNFHVIEGACSITATVNGKPTSGVEIGAIDPLRDLAILRTTGLVTKGLPLGSHTPMPPGSRVITIGFPAADVLGVKPTITEGLYSGEAKFGVGVTMLRISAAISHGSSGGPVFDDEGTVIGVSTLALALRGAQNLNLAVPADLVRAYDRSAATDVSALCKEGKRKLPSEESAPDPRDYRLALSRFKELAEFLQGTVRKSFNKPVSDDVSHIASDVARPVYTFTLSWLESGGTPVFDVSAVDPSVSVVTTFSGYLGIPVVEVRQKVNLRGTAPKFCNDLVYHECQSKGAILLNPRKQKRENSRLLWLMSYQEGAWRIRGLYASDRASELLDDISGKDASNTWREILAGTK